MTYASILERSDEKYHHPRKVRHGTDRWISLTIRLAPGSDMVLLTELDQINYSSTASVRHDTLGRQLDQLNDSSSASVRHGTLDRQLDQLSDSSSASVRNDRHGTDSWTS
jgi:hypothetical protein